MKTIKTSIIESKKYVLFIIIWLLGGIALFSCLTYLLSSFLIFIIGIVIFFIGILLFEKKIQERFSYNILFNLSETYFEILLNSKSHEIDFKNIKIYFEEVYAFRITNSSKDKSVILKVILKNRKQFKWTFMENRKANGGIRIMDEIINCIKNYNTNHNENKIGLISNFFATRNGLIYIIIIGVMTACIIGIEIIYNPKSLLFTGIFVFVFYLIILQQRKSDIEQLKKLE